MVSINRSIIAGNLGRDPEIRVTNSGVKVASFSIATSERWIDKSTGEKRENTDWHNIVVWGGRDGKDGLVGVVEKFLTKGDAVYVEGEQQTRKWQDKTGADRWSTEIVLKGFQRQRQEPVVPPFSAVSRGRLPLCRVAGAIASRTAARC
jgi:single-strand DNA-binding protein